MNEQDTSSSAVATFPETSPYSNLKRIIEEETARAAQRTSHTLTIQPSNTAQPTVRHGLD